MKPKTGGHKMMVDYKNKKNVFNQWYNDWY